MSQAVVPVASLSDLVTALADGNPRTLEIQTSVACPFPIVLPPGFALTGKDREESFLVFGNGDGIGLTADNRVARLTVIATPSSRAIYTQTGMADMGKIALEDLTVYNFSGESRSTIRASLTDVSVGARGAPVMGSGIFVSGFGDQGGSVLLDKLTTGAVHSCGMLPYGTADMITGGVFIVYGVNAKHVEHFGEVVTYGVNDMVLDTWGAVDHWIAHAPVVSYGPSGIGFVNFGVVDRFVAEREIVTHGLGARGFNQYDGTVKNIRFKSIETFGDGSIGIQVSKPVGTIVIDESVTTHGSVGNTLVKGVNMQLPAEAFSVKPGGVVDRLEVHGDLVTHGDGVTSYAVEGGRSRARRRGRRSDRSNRSIRIAERIQIAMWRPPSTLIVSPVTYGASARRKCTAFAMSSGLPSRRSGVCEMMRWRARSSNTSRSGHMIGPGATALTRTSGASSRASERVRPASPAFAVE